NGDAARPTEAALPWRAQIHEDDRRRKRQVFVVDHFPPRVYQVVLSQSCMSLPPFRISRKYGAARLIGMAFTKIRGAQRSYCLAVQWPGKLQVCVNAHLNHFRTPLAISLVFTDCSASRFGELLRIYRFDAHRIRRASQAVNRARRGMTSLRWALRIRPRIPTGFARRVPVAAAALRYDLMPTERDEQLSNQWASTIGKRI